MNHDKYLYGLAPVDFSHDQIKKIPSPILWKHSKEDIRFENELLSRIKKLSDVRSEIEVYREYNQEDITSSPKLIELINQLAQTEQNYSALQPFFNILNDSNKRYAMNLFLETGRNGLLYERFLDIVMERYKYIDPDSKHLIKIIFDLLEEKRPRPLVLYLIGHLSREQFVHFYPAIKKKSPNSIMGCLLYYVSYIPEEDHLQILKALSKLSGLYNMKDRKFKTTIKPSLLKELSFMMRLNVLKHISWLQNYPFVEKVSVSYIKMLLFPLMFSRSAEVENIIRGWEFIDKMAPAWLPDCNFPS